MISLFNGLIRIKHINLSSFNLQTQSRPENKLSLQSVKAGFTIFTQIHPIQTSKKLNHNIVFRKQNYTKYKTQRPHTLTHEIKKIIIIITEVIKSRFSPKYIPTAIQTFNRLRKTVLSKGAPVNRSDRRLSILRLLRRFHLYYKPVLRHLPNTVSTLEFNSTWSKPLKWNAWSPELATPSQCQTL